MNPRSEENALSRSFATKPITEWQGERFVFLDLIPAVRHFGYTRLHRLNRHRESLPYDEYVGKSLRIIDVHKGSWLTGGALTVRMGVEETNEQLSALAIHDCVSDLGYLTDIERARSLFLGKSLWRTSGSLYTLVGSSGGVEIVELNPFDELTVTEVTYSWYDHKPVRFVVRTPVGLDGFVDLNLSGTNISPPLDKSNRFETAFQLTPPRKESAEEARRFSEPSEEARGLAAARGDVLGWQKCWWGMTGQDIKRVLGSLVTRLSAREIYHQAYAEYVIRNYVVGDKNFEVIFQMDDLTNRLKQILMKPLLNQDSSATKAFYSIEALLLEKYGRATHGTNQTLGRQWVFPSTTIELDGQTICYRATPPREANRL